MQLLAIALPAKKVREMKPNFNNVESLIFIQHKSL